MSAEVIYIYYMFTDILCLHRDYFQCLLHCPLKRLVYNSSCGVWAPETFIASALKFAYGYRYVYGYKSNVPILAKWAKQ